MVCYRNSISSCVGVFAPRLVCSCVGCWVPLLGQSKYGGVRAHVHTYILLYMYIYIPDYRWVEKTSPPPFPLSMWIRKNAHSRENGLQLGWVFCTYCIYVLYLSMHVVCVCGSLNFSMQLVCQCCEGVFCKLFWSEVVKLINRLAD